MKTVFTCIEVPASLAQTLRYWKEFEAQASPNPTPRRWERQLDLVNRGFASLWCGVPAGEPGATVQLSSLADGSTRVSLEFSDGGSPAAERSSLDLMRFRALAAGRQIVPPRPSPARCNPPVRQPLSLWG